MKYSITVLLGILISFNVKAQGLYFPPTTSNAWETTDLSDLGWCSDQLPQLYDFLDGSNSKAFIVLKDGKIVIEKYFDTFTQDSLWYWASAGKTITAFMVGKAQEEGDLLITDTTSTYLGSGWTSLTAVQEEKITIRHQLSMSSGLDDGVADVHCTLPSCLTYAADAGNRWAYHNGPYTLLQDVVANATGTNFNNYLYPRLKQPTGMDGLFVPLGYTSVYFSKPRSMARFGLLMLNNGNWDGTQLMTDQTYFNEMITPSQNMNNSYGYLWWLNGQSSFMIPSSQLVLPGSIFPNAPADVYAAMGKNGQIINVSPSNNLVVVRMGDSPGNNPVPTTYCDTIWQKLNAVMCGTTKIEKSTPELAFTMFPNPSTGKVSFETSQFIDEIDIISSTGQVVKLIKGVDGNSLFFLGDLPKGIYFVRAKSEVGQTVKKLILE